MLAVVGNMSTNDSERVVRSLQNTEFSCWPVFAHLVVQTSLHICWVSCSLHIMSGYVLASAAFAAAFAAAAAKHRLPQPSKASTLWTSTLLLSLLYLPAC